MPFLPRKVGRSLSNYPWSTYTLTLICILVFLLVIIVSGKTFGHQTVPSFRGLLTAYGLVPARFEASSIFTHMFLHVGFAHLLSNMYMLVIFGEDVEDLIGPFFFLVCYLICGISGALMHFAMHQHSVIPCVGASGAVSGVMGMFIVLCPNKRLEFVWFWQLFIPSGEIEDSFQISGLAFVVMWILFQVGLGMSTAGHGDILAVAVWAHVGGALAGAFLGLLFVGAGLVQPAHAVSE